MPPVSGDFLSPKGEVEAGLFPQETASALDARIAEYIAQATALVGALDVDLDAAKIDQAIAEYVYWRLYDAILIRIANTPNTSIAEEGSVSFTAAQIAIFNEKRDQHIAAYDAIIAGAVVPPSSGTHGTAQARASFSF